MRRLHRIYKDLAVPEITGLLDMDCEYIKRERRLHGGQLCALERSVAVYYNGKFIGSDIDLFEELSNESTFLLPMEEDYYKISAYLEYVKFLQKSKLYSDLLPETCEVSSCLCTGEMGTNEDGIELNYRDSQIHRIVKTCWIQGGDENLAVIDRWKHGFEEANKSDMILSVYSITSRIGNNTNHLKGILALSPWGFSAAIWNLLSLLISHHECRLTQYPTPASLQDWKLQRFPQRFAVPEITGLLDMDWDEYITRERRLHGGQLWALERSVAVYYNGKFIGSDIDLFEELSNESTFLLPMEEDYYKISAYLEYVKFLQKSKRVYCYMDISIDDAYVGTLTFQLYSDLLPETCEVFRCLCTGEMGTNEDGIELNYRDSQIHRIVKTCWIQGGDIENKIGGGGVSILSRTFPDESYCIGHDRRGVLSMANDGKHTNASQFFITLQPMEWMDYYYVAFGQLVEGADALKSIESVDTYYEMPRKSIKITNCGMTTFEEKGLLAMLRLLLPAKEREREERLPPESLMEGISDFSIQSAEKTVRSIIKELVGKAVGEEESELTLLSSEETALSIVRELLSKATTSSAEQISKSLLKEIFLKATIRPPIDVFDEKDVPSALDVGRYFRGMYSWEYDPFFEYVTPEVYLAPRKSPRIGFFEIQEEEIKYEIPEMLSEGDIPVSPPIQSLSDITLTSSRRDVAAVVRELITTSVTLSETARRYVNRIINDAVRVVKGAFELKIHETPSALGDIATIAREILDAAETEIKVKYLMESSTESLEDEERFIRSIVSDLTQRVLPAHDSKEEIANMIVSDLIIKALDFVCPIMVDTSSVQIAKSVISDTLRGIIKDATGETSSLLIARSIFSETIHTAVPDSSLEEISVKELD